MMREHVTEVCGGHETTPILCREENSWPCILAADPPALPPWASLFTSSRQPVTEPDDSTNSGTFFWEVQLLNWEILNWGFHFDLAELSQTGIAWFRHYLIFLPLTFPSLLADLYVLAFFSLVLAFTRICCKKIFCIFNQILESVP